MCWRFDRPGATRQAQAGLGPATGQVFVADTFDRTVTDGWGRAELGGWWTTPGPEGDYAVSGGEAVMELPEGGIRGGYLGGRLQDRTDVTVTVRRTDGEGSVTVAVVGRRVSSTQDYRTNVTLGADGSVALNLSRRADPERPDDPAELSLSDTVILLGPGSDPESGPAAVTIRMQVIGTNPTTLRAKAWLAKEPASWTVQSSDSTDGLQRPGAVGLQAVRTGGDRPNALSVTDLVGRVAP